jgi:hypothetical protein
MPQCTPIYHNNKEPKKGWERGSSGRALAYQVWGPEFKPQYHLKKRGLTWDEW